MDTGALTQESLSGIFRAISQRRRQGVLEIEHPVAPTQIYFVQGKVAEVRRGGRSPVMEVCQAIIRAGLLAELPNDPLHSYEELLRHLAVSGSGVGGDRLRMIIKHRVLDGLYSINLDGGAYYNFKVLMVDCEREFAPMISIGQVLLDLVAYRSERERFEGMFRPEAILKWQGSDSQAFAAEEQVLCALLKTPIKLDDLPRLSLLSRFHIQEALLSMHERGELAISGIGSQNGGPRAADAGSLLSQTQDLFERAIDQNFAAQASLEASPQVSPKQGLREVQDLTSLIERGPETEVAPETVSFWEEGNRVLQNKLWVPSLVAWLLIISCLLLPYLVWSSVFERF